MMFKSNQGKRFWHLKSSTVGFLFLTISFLCILTLGYVFVSQTNRNRPQGISIQDTFQIYVPQNDAVLTIDTNTYDKKMLELANIPSMQSLPTSSVIKIEPGNSNIWPVKTLYPNHGALLPFNRIVAYYGNFYSPKMGILGEYSIEILASKLGDEVKKWEQVDPTTSVIPAIHYIAAVAQLDPGFNNTYLARMPDHEIKKALIAAEGMKAIVFLDLQIGKSTVVDEVNFIKKYLMLPNVHLALDPEFVMKNDKNPGTEIGSLDADEVNKVIDILAQIVRDNSLPPKILVIHRFAKNSLKKYQDIKILPEVQVVINMDGWGSPETKIFTYQNIIYPEPVQFAGFKIFYKNDLLAPSTRLITPEEILMLQPRPCYIQYQ